MTGVPKHCFFTCRDNVTCLPTSRLGDGLQDCAYGEDENPSDIEEFLGRSWGSCSYACASVYGNASCVPDAFSCDGDADCLEEEDEQGCEGERGEVDCPTFYCGLPGSPEPYCVHEHLICDGYPDCAAGEDEQGCGSADGTSHQGSTVTGMGPTAEPTSGQGSFEEQTVPYAGSLGPQERAVIWMIVTALGGQILYQLAF
ncbi:low-density lipoprotein receptor-like [Branchiostoma lanceolatum]|uniref:low-density lipoprotein receptor-like n=1 Tax=Branchiostoma lanceolatum TaxID=7740 RepID=UPI003452AFC1